MTSTCFQLGYEEVSRVLSSSSEPGTQFNGAGESIALETLLDYMERTISLLAIRRQNLFVWESGCDCCHAKSLLEVATTQVEQRGAMLLLLMGEVVS